ncbi:MAG: DinB family protein [Spirochaetales bacterium]|nr:DinB family protein [Spirochaetales bacterium]
MYDVQMENRIVSDIKKQVVILLKNIDELFSSLDDGMLDNAAGRWPLWRQLYHMLHSMDQWFVNPYRYTDHMGGGADVAGLVEETAIKLSKNELSDYYSDIRVKIEDYLNGLDAAMLKEKPGGCPFTRFELVLGQTRHIMYHIGLIHGIMLVSWNVLPGYHGLSGSVKPGAD